MSSIFISSSTNELLVEGDLVTTPMVLRIVDGKPTLSRPVKPMPTVPGLYKPFDSGSRYRMLKLTETGRWLWSSFYDGVDDCECGDPELYRDTLTLVWAY